MVLAVPAFADNSPPNPAGWKCYERNKNPDGHWELYKCVQVDEKTGFVINRPHICNTKNFIWPSMDEYNFMCIDGTVKHLQP